MTHGNIDEFYENQAKPWWFMRCTHREHNYWQDPEGNEYGCWEVVKEAEQVVILHLTCLHQMHILTELTGAGSTCKTIPCVQYQDLDDRQIMGIVQEQIRDLKPLRA